MIYSVQSNPHIVIKIQVSNLKDYFSFQYVINASNIQDYFSEQEFIFDLENEASNRFTKMINYMEHPYLPMTDFNDFIDFCWKHVWYKSRFEHKNVQLIFEDFVNENVLIAHEIENLFNEMFV